MEKDRKRGRRGRGLETKTSMEGGGGREKQDGKRRRQEDEQTDFFVFINLWLDTVEAFLGIVDDELGMGLIDHADRQTYRQGERQTERQLCR